MGRRRDDDHDDGWDDFGGRPYGRFPPPSRPRAVIGGLRARSRRGAIGETWWSRRFIDSLEDLEWASRLARGRAYARAGQVISLDVEEGEVSALVQGSRRKPYEVSVEMAVLSDADWRAATEVMAGSAVFLARLLNGEMPDQIEEAFAACKVSLFPTQAHSLLTTCTCPDWANPCKHVAAACYLLAEAFDEDPFLIFEWRGRPRARFLDELRAIRGASGEAGASGGGASAAGGGASAAGGGAGSTWGMPVLASEPSLEASLPGFWGTDADLPELRIQPQAAAVPDALLRDVEPAVLRVLGHDLAEELRPLYRVITEAAARRALGDTATPPAAADSGGGHPRQPVPPPAPAARKARPR